MRSLTLITLALGFLLFYATAGAQSVDPEPAPAASAPGTVQVWLTTYDATKKLARQGDLTWSTTQPSATFNVGVNEAVQYQKMDGFGASILAPAIWNADPAVRDEIMRLLFSRSSGIGLSMIRIPMGSTDITGLYKTYDDMPPGQTDPSLANFSIVGDDLEWKLPMMQQAKALNPELTLLGTPWSAPAWMKDSGALGSGKLLSQYYTAHANYFVKWLDAWRVNGLGISAVTMQNEPHFEPGSYQGMRMEPADQAAFALQLGPAIQAAGYSTRIICWDHNCDETNYPITVLSDTSARVWINGSAFHAYAGTTSDMGLVHDADPDKDLYFTEQTGSLPSNGFGGSVQWHVHNLFINPERNYSRCTLIWQLGRQLTSLSGDRPFVRVATDGKSYELYGEYYETGHFSKFVRKGAYRIDSDTDPNGLPRTVAFQNPDGSKVLVVLNDSGTAITISIQNNGRWVSYPLSGGSLATFLWRDTADGDGLAATYFDNPDLTGITESRIDPTVDFNWGGGSPDPAIGYSAFSARWTGRVLPQTSETYTFYTTTSDGVRLWVNNQLLIDQWANQPTTTLSGSIALTANQSASIKLEYFCSTGTGVANLSWSSATVPQQTIPRGQLYSPVVSTVPPPPLRLIARAPGSSVALSWNAAPTATSYTVKRATAVTGPYITLNSGLTSTSSTDSAVTTGTTYYYTVSAVNALGTGSASAPGNATPPGALPSSWSHQDIGSVGVAGNAGSAGATFSVAGSGGDIWNSADAFHFAYLPMTGDGTIIARVASQESTSTWAKSGVMMRETLASNSAYVFTMITPSNGVAVQARTATGIAATGTNTNGPFAPHWVKLVRSGTAFTGYNSLDGVTWTQSSPSVAVSMTNSIYAGLAVTSGNNSATNLSTFDSVSAPGFGPPAPLAPVDVVATAGNASVGLAWNAAAYASSYNIKRGTTPAGPYSTIASPATVTFSDSTAANGVTYYYVITAVNSAGESAQSPEVSSTPSQMLLPTGWIDLDIGDVGYPGSASWSAGIYTLQGSGADIWSTADGCNYSYETVSGDGTMLARVVSISSTTSSTKAGVMFRESTESNARYVVVAVTPSNGITFEYRTATGGSAVKASSVSAGPPSWVKLARSGTSFSAFYSANGTAWTQIGGAIAVPMATDLLAGLEVCAHNNAALASAAFSNVATTGFGSPVTPTGLTATATLGGVNLAWNTVPTATSYNVKRSTVSGSSYSTIVSSATTSFLDSSVSTRTPYYYVVSAVNAFGESGNSSEATATPNLTPLPSAWTDLNIGSVGFPGSADYSTGAFTVRGSGADIWNAADAFNFCYESLTGSGTMSVRVASLQNTNAGAKAGVMFRESTAAGSRYALIAVTPSTGIKFEYRSSTGQSAVAKAVVTGTTAPTYLRLTRSNNTFKAYYSANGASWTQLGSSQSITMNSGILAGLAVSAVNNAALNTATFDNLNAAGYSPPASPTGVTAAGAVNGISLSWPDVTQATGYNVKRSTTSGGPYVVVASPRTAGYVDTAVINHVTYYYIVSAVNSSGESANSAEVNSMENLVTIPSTWNDLDIGAPANAGSADHSNGVFTVRGGGSWIWSTADSFHYCYQAASGDCAIMARVTVVQNTDTYAQTGLMFRESTQANAPYAMIAATFGGGVRFEYRSASGASAGSAAVVSGSAPIWLKLIRAGNVFSAYYGNDGIAWTQAGTSISVPMASGAMAGLAVSAHNNAALNVSSFDYVTAPIPFAPPFMVTGLAAATGSSGAVLIWNPNLGAASYNIGRATSSGGPYMTVATGLTGSIFIDPALGVAGALTRGALYYYTISAVNSYGESGDATRVVAMPFPPGIQVQAQGLNMMIAVPSTAGVTYQLQRRSALTSGIWSNEGLPVAGTGGTIWLTHTNGALSSMQFYRCTMTLPQ